MACEDKSPLNVSIAGVGSISPLGATREQILNSYRSGVHRISRSPALSGIYLSTLSDDQPLESIRAEDRHKRDLDRVTLLSLYSARQAIESAGWEAGNPSHSSVVIIGSARCATGALENEHSSFLNHGSKISPTVSPRTTSGSISSTVAQDLRFGELATTLSSTCTSGLQAIYFGAALIKSGMTNRAVVGGAEAPLTDFVISQMQALGIYSETENEFPCRPCCMEHQERNSFVLGEGSAVFALEQSSRSNSDKPKILGIGAALEPLTSFTSISLDGNAIHSSMQRALTQSGLESVDAVILHAPGTLHGDRAELNALSKLFGPRPPLLLSNKWLTGHTLGASGCLSLELGVLLLDGLDPSDFPYPVRFESRRERNPHSIRSVLINSAGFGGQALSVVVAKK